MKLQGFTAAAVLVLAVGGGVVGGMMSSGGVTPAPAAPATVQIDGVSAEEEAVEASAEPAVEPTATPEPSAPARPVAKPEEAKEAEYSSDVDKVERAVKRAEEAADRAESAAKPASNVSGVPLPGGSGQTDVKIPGISEDYTPPKSHLEQQGRTDVGGKGDPAVYSGDPKDTATRAE